MRKLFQLKLLLNNGSGEVSTMLSGNNVAEICMDIPETLNEMVRGLSVHAENKPTNAGGRLLEVLTGDLTDPSAAARYVVTGDKS